MSMGAVANVAPRVNLGAMTPQRDLAMTRSCLAERGCDYLVFQPRGSSVTVDVAGAPGEHAVAWIDSIDGGCNPGAPVQGGGAAALPAPPGGGDAVLHLSHWPPTASHRFSRIRREAPGFHVF